MASGWLASMFLALMACSSPPSGPAPSPTRRAFYYWRTTFELSTRERAALVELGIDALYVRLFDIAFDAAAGRPAPVGPLAVAHDVRLPDGIEVVPVVFVRNDVFAPRRAVDVAALAASTWRDVRERAGALGVAGGLRELQIDCDWTDSTRDRFFGFVAALREIAGRDEVALSATIRLHQVKYRERTGVPPVARGMLMFYNMGEFAADPAARAIFDPAAAARYLGRVGDYPLPLDVALPIWSWTLHLRDGQVQGLMQSTDPAALSAVELLTPVGPGRYRVARAGFLHGRFLREGDELKAEVTGSAETLAAARMVAARLATAPGGRAIALFDLSERNLRRHGNQGLERVFQAMR